MGRAHAATGPEKRGRHRAVACQERRIGLEPGDDLARRRERIAVGPAHLTRGVDRDRARERTVTGRQAFAPVDDHPAPGHGVHELAGVDGEQGVTGRPIDGPRGALVGAGETHLQRQPDLGRIEARHDQPRTPRRAAARELEARPLETRGEPPPAQGAGDHGIGRAPVGGGTIGAPPRAPRARMPHRQRRGRGRGRRTAHGGRQRRQRRDHRQRGPEPHRRHSTSRALPAARRGTARAP